MNQGRRQWGLGGLSAPPPQKKKQWGGLKKTKEGRSILLTKRDGPLILKLVYVYALVHRRTRQGAGGGATALPNLGKTVGKIWAKQEEKKLCVKFRANQPLCPP